MGAMDGKIVLVTGATNGIGKVAALALAKQGAAVVIAGRNAAKTQATAAEIKQSGAASVDSLVADLSSMAEVRRLADELRQRYTRLDVLINNAGAIFADRQLTADGYERTFALNHLSYFLLTNLLLNLLMASAPSRIVNVASDAHGGATLNFDDLQNQRNYSMGGFRAYGQSKLENILFTYELARRLDGTGVTVNAMNPGPVATGFGENNAGVMRLAMKVFHLFSKTPEQGADTIIYLASSPDVANVSGEYFHECKVDAPSEAARSDGDAKLLWDVSAEIVGLS